MNSNSEIGAAEHRNKEPKSLLRRLYKCRRFYLNKCLGKPMAGSKVDVQKESDKNKKPKHAFSYHSYATKKTIAKGLLDIGLLMANASQLKALLSLGPGQDFYYVSLVLILLSIFLQVIVGVIFIALGNLEGKKVKRQKKANTLNDVSVGFVFAITVVNVFITAFGINRSKPC